MRLWLLCILFFYSFSLLVLHVMHKRQQPFFQLRKNTGINFKNKVEDGNLKIVFFFEIFTTAAVLPLVISIMMDLPMFSLHPTWETINYISIKAILNLKILPLKPVLKQDRVEYRSSIGRYQSMMAGWIFMFAIPAI